MIICLALAAIGGSFQFGWALGVYNIPANVIIWLANVFNARSFMIVCFSKVLKTFYNSTICDDKICPENLPTTVADLWTLTNGLFPLGG